ncbi:cytochrome c oxidase assembly protein [Parapedobacter deserti]|uniref:Cytochrome c oxidase assembly protein n=1 Tax=Parapedobacter deserti TaxID=1912957 RepID=A0ABV7JSM3_9SPHI
MSKLIIMHQHHVANGMTYDSILLLIALSAVSVLYISAVRRLRKDGRNWSNWLTSSFLAGVGMLTIAASPVFMAWAHRDIVGHMAQHLLIGMYAPIFLVMGAPVTLLLKVLPTTYARRFMTFLKSGFFRGISHPATAMLLNIGGMYLLYLTPLYVASLNDTVLHYLIHVHFLAAGFLFTWAIIGPDPVPRRPTFNTRAWVLFLSIAAHAFLGKYMYAQLLPHGSPFSDEAIRGAAKTMYYWGDLSELILAAFFFASIPLVSSKRRNF